MVAIERFSTDFRNTHLGASQTPAALGISPYERPIELWQKYKGILPWYVGNDATELGTALEDGIANVAAARIGYTPELCETLVHPRISWLCATPDRVLNDNTAEAPILQVKTSGLTSYQSADARDRWGEDGSDEVPTHVVAQVQTEMLVARAHGQYHPNVCHVAALLPPRGIVLFKVPYDENLARDIVRGVSKFWEHVQSGEPPPLDGSDAFSDHLKRRFPEHRPEKWVESSLSDEAVLTYLAAKEALDAAEAKAKAARQAVEMLIGDAEGCRGSWGTLPWRAHAGAKRLDQERLRAGIIAKIGEAGANEIIETATVAGAGYRALGPMRPAKVK